MSRQFVYFAEACGKIKIGCTVNPEARIPQISEWVPFPTKLLAVMPGSYVLEKAIHRMFDPEWSHGEWFEASDRLRTFVAQVAEGKPVEIDVSHDGARRGKFIADKKRISHKFTKAYKIGADIPPELWSQFKAVPAGMPVPPELLARINRTLDRAIARSAGKAA